MESSVPDTDRVTFVLDRPSHPGNIGAAARALKVMGFRRLAVVGPRMPDFATHPEAAAFASGATDVLAAARSHATLDAALADATLVIAASAAGRELAPAACAPEEAAALVRAELAASPRHRVALLFGTERTGLSIEDARRAQLLCSIPADPGYSSLNLSQAVMLLAYCLRRGAFAADAPGPQDDGVSYRGHATQAQIEGLYRHLEEMAIAIGFLDPRAPKRLMPRLRRLFSRSRLEQEEVDILRGICRAAIEAAANPGRRDTAGDRAEGAVPGAPDDGGER